MDKKETGNHWSPVSVQKKSLNPFIISLNEKQISLVKRTDFFFPNLRTQKFCRSELNFKKEPARLAAPVPRTC